MKNTPDDPVVAQTMPRPRLKSILDKATCCKLVYVVAGSGYGKTQAVRHYIESQKDAVVRWLQLTESDNIGSRYWEHLTHNISHDNPALASRLREFGFPETHSRFKQFAEILKSAEHRSHKTFLVLDDFHLIDSKQALAFAQRCAHLKIPGACVIIISRTEPQINAVSLFAKGQVSIVTEDELRFTEEEISEFFEWRGIALPDSSKPAEGWAKPTEGWAIAIQLLSLILAKNPKNPELALATLKQNVFKLMEAEAFDDFPDNIQKTLVKLSLISDLPLNTLWNCFNAANTGTAESDASFLKDAPQLASFVWFDSFTGQDRVHPLYWEFLKTKQDILSIDEELETYRQAADWCLDNNFQLDAVTYLAKSRQFERMLVVLLSYPFKLPRDTCEYFLEIMANLTLTAEEQKNTSCLLLENLFVPLLLLGAGDYKQAAEKCQAAISRWEQTDDPAAPLMLSIAYSNLSYIDMYACTVTHKYDAPEYIKKSVEYMRNSTMPPLSVSGAFSVADIRSFACLVGEGAKLKEFDDFLEMAQQTARYIVVTSHSMYYGYDDLVACELAFYKNEPKKAKRHANEAILKAREKGQHSIEAMAAMYLFRIAIQEGNYPLVKELFREKNDGHESPYFWNRKFLYELGVSFLYAQSGLPNMLPSWLAADDAEAPHETSVPVRELICTAKFLMAAHKYDSMLALLCSSYPREPHERFLFGELTLTLLTAVAKVKTGDVEGAIRDFEKAFDLSYSGVFEMPFIELGKDLRPLVAAASASQIPAEWLKTVDRKASAYAKKTAVVLGSFKKEENIADSVRLSQRELEVLQDTYQGLSREEIAASRYLSINTVHKIIQSIFIKLEASNKSEAIRIALEKNLLD